MNDDLILQLEDEQTPFILGLDEPVPQERIENDYEKLENKPQINGIELSGNKTTEQLGIQQTRPLSNLEIHNLLMN